MGIKLSQWVVLKIVGRATTFLLSRYYLDLLITRIQLPPPSSPTSRNKVDDLSGIKEVDRDRPCGSLAMESPMVLLLAPLSRMDAIPSWRRTTSELENKADNWNKLV